MRLLAFFIVLLFTTSTSLAKDHLTPLDWRGTDLFDGYNDFIIQVFPHEFTELAGFYVWPSSTPARYLGIIEADDSSGHLLFYAERTTPQPTTRFTDIPAEAATAISGRLAEIIRLNTKHGDRKEEQINCADGVEFVFVSQHYYGKAFCYEPSSVPDRLIMVYAELVKIGSGDVGSQDVDIALARVVKMLDDLLASIKR